MVAWAGIPSATRADEIRLRALLTRGLDGDPSAYRTFLSDTTGLLRRYVQRQLRRLGRREHEAEDIVQEALIAIHGRRHTYDRDVPVTAWLHAIARYKLIDFLRAMNPAIQDISLDEIEEVGVDGAAQFEAAVTIRQIIARLPDRLRVPTKLVKLDGLSLMETAACTGQSQAAVKANVHRGLKAMARLLK
jgi:RNA polymerase sigma-70 factor (ECF subfamily)